jgi:hypothetical protein
LSFRFAALADYRSKWQMILAVLAAVVIAIILYKNPSAPEGSFPLKGGASVAILVEQGGKSSPWTTGMPLAEGAKVQVEMYAAKPSVAFWGLTAKGGRLLSDPSTVLAQRLEFAGGETKPFPSSLDLTGPSESETLVIAVCPAGYVQLDAPETPELLAKLLLFYSTDTLSECHTQRFTLR